MKIYTKTGDGGETGLRGGVRVRKHHLRIEVYGTVDELNAVVGLAATASPPQLAELLGRIQNHLFDLGAELALPREAAADERTLRTQQTAGLEAAIDAHEAHLAPLRQFILPGGSPAGAWLHLARTVCRRAERLLTQLGDTPGEPVAAESLAYLNRLSDLLFVLARRANALAGRPDEPWQQGQT